MARIILCPHCEKKEEHHALGLCWPCYDKFWKKVKRQYGSMKAWRAGIPKLELRQKMLDQKPPLLRGKKVALCKGPCGYGCGLVRPVYARGMCQPCYQKWYYDKKREKERIAKEQHENEIKEAICEEATRFADEYKEEAP